MIDRLHLRSMGPDIEQQMLKPMRDTRNKCNQTSNQIVIFNGLIDEDNTGCVQSMRVKEQNLL